MCEVCSLQPDLQDWLVFLCVSSVALSGSWASHIPDCRESPLLSCLMEMNLGSGEEPRHAPSPPALWTCSGLSFPGLCVTPFPLLQRSSLVCLPGVRKAPFICGRERQGRALLQQTSGRSLCWPQTHPYSAVSLDPFWACAGCWEGGCSLLIILYCHGHCRA